MALIHVTISNPNISKAADACSRHHRRNLPLVLIWLNSEHGISWTYGKGNHFRGLQATAHVVCAVLVFVLTWLVCRNAKPKLAKSVDFAIALIAAIAQ
jgi:hypothetical protein